jgi:hypothetical protein
MGDGRKQALRTQFDGRLKLDFLGAKITTDAGLFLFRELDEAFRLAEVAVPRELFAAILERIQRFGVPPPLVRHG